MANYYCIFIVLFLVGCGSASESSNPPEPPKEESVETPISHDWRGGLYGIWEPIGTPRGVMILHQGHNCFDGCNDPAANLIPVAERFRDAGFLVYGFEMPPGDHNADQGPIERFYAPVLSVIDAIPEELPIYMAGLSGGGWTTTVVTALSERIVHGYSVSGDAPLDVWYFDREHNNPGRDWEQSQFDMRELYARAGERLLHFYILHDPCCFYGITGDTGYAYISDPTTTAHTMTPAMIDYMLADIAQH